MDDMWQMVTGVLTTALSGSAGEIGKQAWTALTDILRSRFGRGTRALDLADRPQDFPVEGAVRTLREAAATDSDFEQLLSRWCNDYNVLLKGGEGDVKNVVAGTARVKGSVVQARDVGKIRFGE